jgi:AraC-like DNA-binding protein
MARRTLGYQFKIKISTFRIRAAVRSPLAVPPSGSRETVVEENRFTEYALSCAVKAKEILTADIRTHYSIRQLAQMVGLNTRGLYECFKHLYGKPMYEWLRNIRLDKGKALLAETKLTVQEVAEEIGYVEEASFGKSFKKKFGVSPGEWRKRLH